MFREVLMLGSLVLDGGLASNESRYVQTSVGERGLILFGGKQLIDRAIWGSIGQVTLGDQQLLFNGIFSNQKCF